MSQGVFWLLEIQQRTDVLPSWSLSFIGKQTVSRLYNSEHRWASDTTIDCIPVGSTWYLNSTFFSVYLGTFICSTAIIKYHRQGSINNRNLFSSQLWRLQVQDQGIGKVDFFQGLSPCLGEGQFQLHVHKALSFSACLCSDFCVL